MKKRVLVLGGSGFIGSRICRALALTDWAQPVAASRSSRSSGEAGVEFVTCDANDSRSLAVAAEGVHAIVVAVVGSAAEMIANARALAELAKSHPARIVYLSSMAAYGSATGLITEDSPLLGDLDDYARGKATAEQALSHLPDCVVLRPGIVYGPGSVRWSALVGRLLMARRLGDLGPKGDGICNLVHVDDVVAATLACLKAEQVASRAYNLASTPALTWNDYFIAYARALGATPVHRIGARRLKIEGKILAPVFKILEKIVGASRARRWGWPDALPPSILRVCEHDISLESTRAREELGLVWTPLDEGLAKTAAWFSRAGPDGA